jgi:hypothetical protein
MSRVLLIFGTGIITIWLLSAAPVQACEKLPCPFIPTFFLPLEWVLAA